MELYNYQKEGIEFMTSRRHSLNADAMGLGKTIQVLGAYNKLGAKSMLIICPKSVKHQWASMVFDWVEEFKIVQVLEGMKANLNQEANIIILNYNLVLSEHIRKQIQQRFFAVGVMDECHYLQSIESLRTKFVLGKAGLMYRCYYKFALSGTPLTRPRDLFPILYTLSPECLGEYNTFTKFAFKYCGAYIDYATGNLVATGASNCEELSEKLKSFMIRRTDVIELPDVVYDVVPVYIKNYKETAYHIETQRKETAIEKIKATVGYIQDFVKTSDKTILFFYHRAVGKLLKEILEEKKIKNVYIDGSTSILTRTLAKQDFIKSKNCIGLFQFQAAGEGLDGLQTVCNQILFCEGSWIPKDIQQAVGRLRRHGQKHRTVFVKFLVVHDSIEYYMMNKMIKHRKIIRRIID